MKKLLPLFILLAAAAITALLIIFKPAPKATSPERPITSVETVTAQPTHTRARIHSQGTLLPRVETELTAEVSGRIIAVSEHFEAGAIVTAGDLLLQIDPADYQAAVAARQAELAGANLTLAQEQALAEQAVADWAALGQGEASPLTLRAPQIEQARALVASAKAALAKAQRDLERCQIRAPYTGQVLSKLADLGQFITASPGQPIGRIFATDLGEIRLPITQRDATLLDDPRGSEQSVLLYLKDPASGPIWNARVDRIEASIDPQSRQLYVVAQLEAPFATTHQPDEPSLRRGIFLQAEIQGRRIDPAYILPRYALRSADTLYVLDADNQLSTRKVQIVQSDTERVVIAAGLKPGERVAISPIAYYVENMPVNPLENK